MEKISVAVTTFNRFELTVKCISKIILHERVGEIVILDDCSTDDSYGKLKNHFASSPKVKVIPQARNRGMSLNKRDAIALCANAYVAILDSDNGFDRGYIDAIPDRLLFTLVYMPSFAAPNFDYRAFEGLIIDKNDVKQYLFKPMFEQLLNTCNMVVHRDTYLNVYEYNDKIKETDTLWMNYLLLKAGVSFYVVPNMEYQHLVHAGSGWLQNADYNIARAEETKKLILKL